MGADTSEKRKHENWTSLRPLEGVALQRLEKRTLPGVWVRTSRGELRAKMSPHPDQSTAKPNEGAEGQESKPHSPLREAHKAAVTTPMDALKAATSLEAAKTAYVNKRAVSREGSGSSLVNNLREAVKKTSSRKLMKGSESPQSPQSRQASQRWLSKQASKSASDFKSEGNSKNDPELPSQEASARNLQHEAPEQREIPLEFGDWTTSVEISKADDGTPSCTSKDNKHGDFVPSARGGISIPSDAKAEWKFKLVRARGLICIGMQSGKIKSGIAFRKPDHRDQVWYYSSDGTLRNGARTVGKKGVPAETGDIITMRLANKTLTFHVNETPLTDGIPKVDSSPLFFSLQMHRKEDCVTLLSEQFDARTAEYLRHFSWGSTSVDPDGAQPGDPMVTLEKQRTQAVACVKGAEYHGGVVPAVRGSKVVNGDGSAVWNVYIESVRKAVYIGLEREDWHLGVDWWCDEAVGHAWYYGSDGSLRNGNQVVAKSQVLTRQMRAIAPVTSGGHDDEDEEEDHLMHMTAGREGMLEEDYFEPFIPHIRATNMVQVKLHNSTLTFTINGDPVEGQIEGVTGRVRLAVQMEDQGDAVAILPDTERQLRGLLSTDRSRTPSPGRRSSRELNA